ncbi:MAG: PQQ-dependent dehydrogenase, methanol/ethanol family [Puia sp.]|nr:PQQ-dependent dehydrogenase, methanol/ethanol family [Puia sp.]
MGIPGSATHIRQVTGPIDDDRLVHAGDRQQDWLTYGLNYAEDRYSPLTQINKDNIRTLGLAWSLDLGTQRGLEATALVADGIMFLTGPWSMVYAIDTRKGSVIWKYDPQVPRSYGEKTCCDVVNRGAALFKGRVYVGTLDGRLIALDASTGIPVWSVMTVDTTKPYSITGAPRIVQGKVIIGNGGAEYGVRGYITAYDALSGKQVWRFYTVPGDPAKPFESKAMKDAARTWTGEWWKYGGGGTAWDAMAYDPALNLLYVGTGNGSPWDRNYRSPGGGDNLYLSSILAINPENGQLVWYYQTTPGESWDFTATQPIILADLILKGQKRKILMQAPKNGFFYVLDRTNGAFISADPYVYVNWAKGVDQTSGRPLENRSARYTKENSDVAPDYDGGHNWHPMAYNPRTGLVYIPARENIATYGHDPNWIYNKRGGGVGNGWNVSIGFDSSVPTRRDTLASRKDPRGMLIAWDPVQRKEIWRVDQKNNWNGGVLATASDLVFQGTADGFFVAYDAKNGAVVWQVSVGGGVIAPPVTYMVDGRQYVSLVAGWGGGVGMKFKSAPLQPGRVYTFTLGGTKEFPEFNKSIVTSIPEIPFSATNEEITHGRELFRSYCSTCHVIAHGGGGLAPDLAFASPTTHRNFLAIVRDGAYLPFGMPRFGNRLSERETLDIQKFILSSAKRARYQSK